MRASLGSGSSGDDGRNYAPDGLRASQGFAILFDPGVQPLEFVRWEPDINGNGADLGSTSWHAQYVALKIFKRKRNFRVDFGISGAYYCCIENGETDMRTQDQGNNETISRGIFELHGRFTALTFSESKTFKTRKGAETWLAKRGYRPDGKRVAA